MKRIVCLLLVCLTYFPALPAAAQNSARRAGVAQGPVILASFDGLANHIVAGDRAARELRALRRVQARGVTARGMIQSFPSVTPVGHSAIWTGAYGNVSNIIAAGNPVTPRDQHSAFDRLSGYSAELLKAEPLWVTAARQGVGAVAHHATQNHPFVTAVTAPGAETPPVLVSGYGPAQLAREAVITARSAAVAANLEWEPALPRSALPVREYRWQAGPLTFHGALVAERGAARGYTAMIVAADPRGPRVRVALRATEAATPHSRELARHFSEPLPVTVGEKRLPSVAYFRLFEVAPDGGDFMLYQPAIYEVAIYDGSPDTRAVLEAMLREAGGFLGNGPSWLYSDGKFGKQVYAGGDGTAERRYLEGLELVTRQYNRLTDFFWRRYRPRLLIDYLPYPDEMDHTWYGLARPDVTGVEAGVARRIQQFRAWGYAAINTRVALLDRLAGPRGAFVVVSDHGMEAVAKEVRVNVVLRNAGLLAVEQGAGGREKIDPARTQAVHIKYCVLVNTKDWRGGLVPVEKRKETVDRIEQALRAVRDPETGKPVFKAFFRPETDGERLGIGGEAGADLYFELAPNYTTSDALSGEEVTERPVAYGTHGNLPTRPEMLATFIARGPGIAGGRTIPTIRSIDVASLISDLLGISPPANNRGKSPLK